MVRPLRLSQTSPIPHIFIKRLADAKEKSIQLKKECTQKNVISIYRIMRLRFGSFNLVAIHRFGGCVKYNAITSEYMNKYPLRKRQNIP